MLKKIKLNNNNTTCIVVFIVMLILAFIRCYQITHNLFWAYEPDFDRDIGLIQGTLEGHYGKDPNFLGEYIWYNPLIFLTETAIVKISGLPIHIVVTRAGPFLNILSPIAFFIMLAKLFDVKLALASSLSFLFLATGNINCWGAATYSPWLLADNFVQFLFYLNIIFCYKAFLSQRIQWFLILGVFLGISFLGHAAPTLLIILILISIQGEKILRAFMEKNFLAVKNYFLQGVATFIPFLIVSFPFFYFVVIKYHLHIVNHSIVQFADGIFSVYNILDLIKINISFSLVISIIGFVWFWKKFHNTLIRKIIFNWLFITMILYVYEAVLPKLNHVFNIFLPDTVPSFHYFFYLKAAQSVFFGFGFLFLIEALINLFEVFVRDKFKPAISSFFVNYLFLFSILLYVLIYYPIYKNRADFVDRIELAAAKGNDKDKLGIYSFILKNIPSDDVILCEHSLSVFPVMATGRKMVSIENTFSNPYVDYEKREADRNNMLLFLKTSRPDSARKLFFDYKVNIILLSNKEFENLKFPLFVPSSVVFRNNSYTIISMHTESNRIASAE